ncbi:TPA_asm: DUF1367 family protein [Salmonella enterica subsp. enterica serovar Enteritidis]|uniref:DUF1367 family protein n=5 Tax=Salmonella enterica TaxID=28901 RepID=A0A6X7PDG6_SALEN|nr:DUF1367 family protein [Salmonella enterica subsp. enterica serovar Enteritidis]EJV6189792.1 DUF1367 family protein [Salmonella enterica]HAB1254380.1 DUF1367 family protein [Salmonella enterica subsp. enterica serovar Enteritidis]HAB1516371.1 DUF1367 family protein [Salmonella enterica subsp. enterica serovar Enteritidis]HAB2969109.1 DUF1367 family protein [Salmonella enterica subsp. enterica serovar Enteritidis]
MAHLQLVKQTSSGLLLPATPESGDFLRSVKIGEWIHADFKRVRNYAFHKRFFKLLQLGFDYWTPTGGTVTSREQKLISGFVNFLCDSAGQEYIPALNEAAEQYLHNVATLRTGDVALLKSFDAFREWVTIQAGFYDEYTMPDGSRRKVAKSISFASMDDAEFNGVYQSVLNVLWNYILRRKFRSANDAENAASQLMSFAG